ncbi:hypothetical protein VTJ04DRAFT_4877 [Mycothermus thermophilus]|uniref:uncharacterized protein n=1 Tax=Humicola insolens TaxID=85995 RepID=UPI0037446D88
MGTKEETNSYILQPRRATLCAQSMNPRTHETTPAPIIISRPTPEQTSGRTQGSRKDTPHSTCEHHYQRAISS